MEVRKRNGDIVPFDLEKIAIAISGAFEDFDEEFYSPNLLEDIEWELKYNWTHSSPIDIEEIQDLVEDKLIAYGFVKQAKAYIRYRYKHELARQEHNDEEVLSMIKGSNDYWEKENSNKNPDLVTVHLVENLKDVSNTDPKAKVSVQRRVVINNPDGTHDTVTVKVNLARTAMYNEATKSTNYGTLHIESAPITVYDHTRDNGEDEDSGFITGDLLKGALNGDIAKYVHNGGQVLANRNGVTIMQIPQIDIPDQTGYAREIDNANTDGINLSNEFIPAEDIIVADSDKQLEEMGTETNSMPVINVDNRNFDGELDKTIVVHYVKGQKEMTYRYVDRQSGRVVGGDSVIGEPGQTVEIVYGIPDGYHLDYGQHLFPSTYTFGDANNVTKTVYVIKNAYVSNIHYYSTLK